MKVALSTLVTVALVVTAGCGGGKVVVGVVLPITGDASAYGTSIKSGVKLAFDDALAKHQEPQGLEVIYRDTGSEPARAAAEAEAMFKQGAKIVIGGVTSPEAREMIPLAERYHAVVLSPSASEPDLAASSNLFFRVYPSDDVEGVKAADFLAVDKKVKTLIVLKEDNTYTKGLLPIFTEEFEKRGGKLVGTIRIGSEGWEKTFADALAKEKPDALYVCGYGEAILSAVVEIRNDKFAGIVCTTSAIGTVDLVWRGGKLVEGLYFPMMKLDLASQQEPLKSFVAHYKEANNNLAPDIYAACGYDAGTIVLDVYKGTPPADVSDLVQRILGLADVRGVTGKFEFDDVGNIKHRLRMHQIRDGKVVDVDPSPAD
ncbi:MAG: ABC transporter substrate-binding protein [Acidobacteriota bacterium]